MTDQANLPATTETGSLDPSIAQRGLTALHNLPARLDDAMLAEVDRFAAMALPALPKPDEQTMARSLKWLDAALPRQKTDDATGDMRVMLFHRKLGHLPTEALNHACNRAIDELDWFPTIKQMLAFAKGWTRSDDAIRLKVKAQHLANRERQQRLDDARLKLRRERVDQAEIDAMPPAHKLIFETEGLLRQCDCGSYAQSSQWRAFQSVMDVDPAEAIAAAKARFPSRREGLSEGCETSERQGEAA